MDLKFHDKGTERLPAIPFLTFEGPEEVETVAAAATYAARQDENVAPRKRRGGYKGLASTAMQEAMNHDDQPGVQRLKLVEDQAITAMTALRSLAAAPREEVAEVWGSVHVEDPIALSQELVVKIDEAFSKFS